MLEPETVLPEVAMEKRTEVASQSAETDTGNISDRTPAADTSDQTGLATVAQEPMREYFRPEISGYRTTTSVVRSFGSVRTNSEFTEKSTFGAIIGSESFSA